METLQYTKRRRVMKKFFMALFLLIPLLVIPAPKHAEAAVDLGVSIGEEGIRSFYFSVGDYYRVPETTVVAVSRRRIPDDELPVVFFIADRAHVPPAVIVDMRLRGLSWWNISMRYHIGPEVYYVPVKAVQVGPPYGRAYGYYKKWPRSRWKEIRLSDPDIVNLVNLRFISDYQHISPDHVIVRRSHGQGFKVIHTGYEKERLKREREKEREHAREWKEDRGHGRDD
jgi:hypothetical protein